MGTDLNTRTADNAQRTWAPSRTRSSLAENLAAAELKLAAAAELKLAAADVERLDNVSTQPLPYPLWHQGQEAANDSARPI